MSAILIAFTLNLRSMSRVPCIIYLAVLHYIYEPSTCRGRGLVNSNAVVSALNSNAKGEMRGVTDPCQMRMRVRSTLKLDPKAYTIG